MIKSFLYVFAAYHYPCKKDTGIINNITMDGHNKISIDF